MPPTLPQSDCRVTTAGGVLRFNGRAVHPFGGELPYFRVRDPGGDARRTHELWAETLDRMYEAGLNLVSTYVPWDWHEPAPGRFDFAGDRDLGAFLEMAWQRHFLVCLKPGPFITAEWPRGFGTFGAVPDWFRARHPRSLVRRPGGGAWSFHPLGARDQTQPAYDDPVFLEATRRWFGALAPIVRRYVRERPAIAMLQLDNETNLFWTDLGHIEGHGDYDRRQRHCEEYLSRLKEIWRGLGIGDADVLFTANDSPFPIPGRHTLLPAARGKSALALNTLDTYPRALPHLRPLADQPFQAPYFTKLFGGRGYAFAAEIQAMELKFLMGVRAEADPSATGHLLTQLFGSGLRGGVLYVIREGLNADGTLYGPGAPLSLQGHATARWEIVRAFAALLARHGDALAAVDPAPRIAVVTHRAHASDPVERGRLWAIEAPAVFGWLRMAGWDPAVIDLEEASAAELSRFAGLACVRPELFPAADRAKLDAAVEAGATLVAFACGEGSQPFGRMLPGADDALVGLPWADGELTTGGGPLRVRMFRDAGRLEGAGEVILRGPKGKPLGFARTRGRGRELQFATRLASDMNRPEFYGLTEEELLARRAAARAVFAGIEPEMDAGPAHVEAWRRGPFVFVVNHGPAAVARLGGIVRAACAFDGGARDPQRLPIPEHGWAVLVESVPAR